MTDENGNTFRTVNGVGYLFVAQGKTYDDAKSYCESKVSNFVSGKLFEPMTTTDSELVNDEARTVFGGGFYYIGINDRDNTGQWVYSSSGQTVSNTMWASSQPGSVGSQHCAFAYVSGPLWYDHVCSHFFIVRFSHVNFFGKRCIMFFIFIMNIVTMRRHRINCVSGKCI